MDRPIPLRSSIVLPLGIYAALTALWYLRPRPRPRTRYVAVPGPLSSAQRPTPLEGIALRETAAPDTPKGKESREASVPRGWWALFSHAASQWSVHKDARLGAALAYYSVFSIGPLIVVAVVVAGLIFGQDAVRGEVAEALRGMLGESGAQAINGMLVAADRPYQGIFATAIGIGALIFAAIGVVVQVKDAMNTVWDVTTPPGRGLWGFARAYVLSFAGVLALGFLLLVSMLVTTALAAVGKYIGTYLPEGSLQAANLTLLFGHHDLVRDDVQMAAGHQGSLAGCLARRGADGGPVRGRKIPDRLLHRQARARVHLWCGRLARHRADLGLLLRADRAVRRRDHQRARQAAARSSGGHGVALLSQ